jgi:hypothetical protein
MRKKIFYLFILTSWTYLGYLTYKNFSINQDDVDLYYNLLNRKNKLTSCEALKRKPLCQNRVNVQKDIFMIQNKTRLHFRICSENSVITLSEKKDNVQFVENLENIKCLVQDKISYNQEKKSYEQELRYFTAKEGIYTYPSHKFITDSINLSFFQVPGILLPESLENFQPHLRGFAKEVSFQLTDQAPKLNASHFRASFDLEKEIQ